MSDESVDLRSLEIETLRTDRISPRKRVPAILRSHTKLVERRVYQLWLDGLTDDEIVKETGLELRAIRTMTKRISKEIDTVDRAKLYRMLRTKVVSILHRHDIIAAELYRAFTEAVRDREGSDVPVQSKATALGRMLAVANQLNMNDRTVSGVLQTMGVPTLRAYGTSLPPSDSVDEKNAQLVPSDISEAQVLTELEESATRLAAYVRVRKGMIRDGRTRVEIEADAEILE